MSGVPVPTDLREQIGNAIADRLPSYVDAFKIADAVLPLVAGLRLRAETAEADAELLREAGRLVAWGLKHSTAHAEIMGDEMDAPLRFRRDLESTWLHSTQAWLERWEAVLAAAGSPATPGRTDATPDAPSVPDQSAPTPSEYLVPEPCPACGGSGHRNGSPRAADPFGTCPGCDGTGFRPCGEESRDAGT